MQVVVFRPWALLHVTCLAGEDAVSHHRLAGVVYHVHVGEYVHSLGLVRAVGETQVQRWGARGCVALQHDVAAVAPRLIFLLTQAAVFAVVAVPLLLRLYCYPPALGLSLTQDELADCQPM